MIILISKLLIRKSSLLVRGVVVHVQPVFPLFPRTEIALLNPVLYYKGQGFVRNENEC